MNTEKWTIIHKKADFDALASRFGLDPLTVRILANRGIDTEDKMELFLNGTLKDMHDPRLLKDAEKTVKRLSEALKAGEKIAVASDFDADGIFSGLILKNGLKKLGAEVTVFTPDRLSEGYGLNRRIVDEAAAFGASLLITCDNGIAALDAVRYAAEKGMTVLVTDHHELARDEAGNAVLPDAFAVVDPKQEDCPYPFKEICGAMVAFKIISLLYEMNGVPESEKEELIPYAAIATVTDVMELTDENRIIVKEGLKRLASAENLGLRTLIRVTGLEGRSITAYHLGFVLGPCFNAAGRLETVDLAHRLLEAASEEEAAACAEELQRLNNIRKSLTNEGLRAAEKQISEMHYAEDPILVVYLPDCHESVAGIIAGRLKEMYHRPALVITGKDEICKGSGRSIEAYHMFNGLNACKDLLVRFGGHPMAAGFSLRRENIGALREMLCRNSGLTEEDLTPVVRLDAAMPPAYATEERIREWESLAPFGKGNEKPLFGKSRLKVTEIRVLGQARNAVRMRFADEDGLSCDGIWFGDADRFEAYITEEFGEKAFRALERRQKNLPLALSYQPAVHEFAGRKSIQFVIQNFRAVHPEQKS